ncbi:hypothetical protein KIPB_001280 [Kipferlia bialata]|uniref:Uncharacterized protein n=1 Tax=Kipferlia bialata TaxID=797122 RepID=A0A9K3CNL9_9EUKA|nr:hypothetical protein KIPB_001280 [Kipferlia bialata]|eukprot:g1280.t1
MSDTPGSDVSDPKPRMTLDVVTRVPDQAVTILSQNFDDEESSDWDPPAMSTTAPKPPNPASLPQSKLVLNLISPGQDTAAESIKSKSTADVCVGTVFTQRLPGTAPGQVCSVVLAGEGAEHVGVGTVVGVRPQGSGEYVLGTVCDVFGPLLRPYYVVQWGGPGEESVPPSSGGGETGEAGSSVSCDVQEGDTVWIREGYSLAPLQSAEPKEEEEEEEVV